MCLENIRNYFWNRIYNKKKTLKKQKGYIECYDERVKRYNTKGFGHSGTFDDWANGKTFLIR